MTTSGKVSWNRCLELDPLVNYVVAHHEVISDGDLSALCQVGSVVVSTANPLSSLVVADGSLDVEGLCTAVLEVGIVHIPGIDPDAIEADRVFEERRDIRCAAFGGELLSGLFWHGCICSCLCSFRLSRLCWSLGLGGLRCCCARLLFRLGWGWCLRWSIICCCSGGITCWILGGGVGARGRHIDRLGSLS